MEIQFPRSEHRYLRCICRGVQTQELTHELRLGDGMPDIGRVISAWGQVILRSKEWRRDSIACSGGVMAWILYIPEDGSRPRSMECWVPFQMKWDMEDSLHDGEIRIHTLLRYADARSISPRKIMLRLGVEALGEGWIQDSADVYMPEGISADIQLLTKTYPLRLQKEAGEKSFSIDEVVELNDPLPEKLICFTVENQLREKKMIGNKLLFRGNGRLHLLYAAQDGMLHSQNFEMPFSQYTEIAGELSDAVEADICIGITGLEAEMENENRLRIKCGLLAQYLISDRQMITVAEDAYSPAMELKPSMESLDMPAVLGQKQMTIDAKDSVHKDVGDIADVIFLPGYPTQLTDGDQITWEIPGTFQTLYYDSANMLQSSTARWNGRLSMQVSPDTEIAASLTPGEEPQASVDMDGFVTNGHAALDVQIMSGQGIPMVTGVTGQPRETDNHSRPSLILRRAGEDSLWQIAKGSGSTMDMIRKANGLEGEPAPDRMLLIPVI